MYIVFEGIIGTGKTTQSKRLYEYLKKQYKDKEVVWTREPGGTEISDEIREVVQGKDFKENMDPICEAYLYAASRAQSLRTVVKPVLEKHGTVVADRSFLTSLTNQAYGRKIGYETVWAINKPAVGNIIPDIIIYMDLDIKEGLERVFDEDGDKFEKLGIDFYTLVRNGYKEMEKMYKDKWINIDASGTEDEVFNRIIEKINPLLNDL